MKGERLSGVRRGAVVAGLAAVAAAALVAGCDSSDDEAQNQPPPPAAGATTAQPGAAPEPGAAPHGATVGPAGLRVFRRGRELTVTYEVAGASQVIARVSSVGGERLGQQVDNWPAAGPAITRIDLSRSASPVRVKLVIRPTDGAGAGRVLDIVTSPREPRFSVLSPKPNEVVRGSEVTLDIRSQDLNITDEGTPLRRRQGHFHVTLDDRTYVVVYGRRLVMSDVAPGSHSLLVQPAANDHSPFPGVDPVTINFTVESGERIPARRAARRSWLLLPTAATVLTGTTPTLAWTAAASAVDVYNVQIFDAATGRKVLSRFPTQRRLEVPANLLEPGKTYVWRVWPNRDGRFLRRPLGLSWFSVAP